MNNDEIKEYISEHEPDNTIKDELGRWILREWNLDSGKIQEIYEYKHSVNDVNEGNAAWIASGRVHNNPVRDSFAIKNVETKYVSHEN